jgi:divalent metal cation (Fe/Co/Zn/Cd) transporter
VSISRTAAINHGIRLEVLTIAWMLVEAVVAIGAGVLASSVLLTAFGVDSVVELLSGIVLLRRLSTESAGESDAAVERLEARTTRISAVLLVALCAYVVLSSIAGLWLRIMPSGSIVGIAIAAIALIAMPVLARAKRGVNHVLGSPSLRADIAETISCAYLAGVTLLGLAVSMLFGWWWAQYVAALALLFWLVPETFEAFEQWRDNGGDQGGQGD